MPPEIWTVLPLTLSLLGVALSAHPARAIAATLTSASGVRMRRRGDFPMYSSSLRTRMSPRGQRPRSGTAPAHGMQEAARSATRRASQLGNSPVLRGRTASTPFRAEEECDVIHLGAVPGFAALL